MKSSEQLMSPDDKFDRDMAELESDLESGHIDYNDFLRYRQQLVLDYDTN